MGASCPIIIGWLTVGVRHGQGADPAAETAGDQAEREAENGREGDAEHAHGK